MTITDAIIVFLYQSGNVDGLPFDLRPSIPNVKTIAAIKEADRITNDPSAKRYADFLKQFVNLCIYITGITCPSNSFKTQISFNFYPCIIEYPIRYNAISYSESSMIQSNASSLPEFAKESCLF